MKTLQTIQSLGDQYEIDGERTLILSKAVFSARVKLKDRYRDKNEEGNSYTGFCINLKKFDNVRLDTLIRFLSLKIFGLIPTVDFLYYKGEENREEIVVVQKMEMYECLPSGFKFSDIKPETAYRQIFELIILMAELNQRKLPWINIVSGDMFTLKGHIFLQPLNVVLDLPPISAIAEQQSLGQFIKLLVSLGAQSYYQHITQAKTYKELTKHAIEVMTKNLNPPIQSLSRAFAPYLDFIERIFTFPTRPKQITDDLANSFVVSVPAPRELCQLYNIKEGSNIVIKQTNLPSENDEHYLTILKNIDREIQFMENFRTNQHIAVCFTYVRIMQYSFLIMPQYDQTLQNLCDQLVNERRSILPAEAYRIAYEFAAGIKLMHNQQMIHRDLKPDNIFMLGNCLRSTQVFVGDFDRSRSLAITSADLQQTLNHQFTPQYTPPDQNASDQIYDVWQWGLIIFQLLNQGEWVGHQSGAVCLIEEDKTMKYDNLYGLNAITNTLKKKSKQEYSDDLLKLIADCLHIDPKSRPTSDDLMKRMRQIYLQGKIRIINNGEGQSLNVSSPTKRT